MNTKKQLALLVGLVVVALAVITFSWITIYQDYNFQESTINIGVVGHFSGEYASYSIPMKQAIELYVDEVNENGGIDGREVNLIFEDDGTDTSQAASAVQKLVNVDGVDYIISAQGSGATSAVAPIAQDSKKILMITLGSAPGLPQTGEYVFRSVTSDVYQGNKMSDFIEEDLKARSVAILYVNDAYGFGIEEIIMSHYNVVASESFEKGATDFRTQLTKIKNAKPEVLVLVSRQDAPLILKQMHELGLDNLKIIVDEATKDENVLDQAADLAEGMYALSIRENIDYADFDTKYKAKFGEDPSAYGQYAYDGAQALLMAIDKADSLDVEDVRDELADIQFKGASGSVGFDKDGDRTGTEYDIYVVRGGEFVLIQ